MYKYIDNVDDNISLHDCRASHISVNDGAVSFVFDNGFLVGANHKLNPYEEPMYTDKSDIRFYLLSKDTKNDIMIYIFTNESGRTFREECSLEDFMSMINSGSAELEFLYSYKGYQSVVFECWLWFDEEPYHKECVLIISEDKAACYWNKFLIINK